jgi:hypothetical protein
VDHFETERRDTLVTTPGRNESNNETNRSRKTMLDLDEAFAKHGWKVDRITWSGIKFFETCESGGSDAIVYVYPSGRLHADYRSEGRNVLEALRGSISPDIETFGGTPAGDVEAFLVEVERVIDESYGRRMYRLLRTP